MWAKWKSAEMLAATWDSSFWNLLGLKSKRCVILHVLRPSARWEDSRQHKLHLAALLLSRLLARLNVQEDNYYTPVTGTNLIGSATTTASCRGKPPISCFVSAVEDESTAWFWSGTRRTKPKRFQSVFFVCSSDHHTCVSVANAIWLWILNFLNSLRAAPSLSNWLI